MKKFFTMALVSMGCFMAHAQLTIPEVNIAAGSEKTVEVTIPNSTSYTAFQFDLAIPEGFAVKEASLTGGGDNRKFESGVVDGKYRVLSYDMNNDPIPTGAALKLTLEAEATAGGQETTAEVEGLVLVAADGTATEPEDGGSFALNGLKSTTITIGSSGATTYVADVDLDFTDSDLKAYSVTGKEGNGFWLTRLNKVPAGTAIFVKGDEGEHAVAQTTIEKTYYQNMLIGNNTEAAISITPVSGKQYYYYSTKGFSKFTAARNIGAHKAYMIIDELPTAKAGEDLALTIGSGQRTTICANVDLDFSELTDVKAYAITGYDGAFWMSRVLNASAGTPLYIRGPQGSYTVKSTATQTIYANMLVGNNTDESITIHPTDGEYTNYYLSTLGFSRFNADRKSGAHKAYLRVLTSYLSTPASTRGITDPVVGDNEAETIFVEIVNDGTTGIEKITPAVEGQNDAIYNLNGQRVENPRKGLYIINGKKVVIK